MEDKNRLVARTELSEEELESALKYCAEEKIHIPGKIQPHGIFFAVDKETYDIKYASKNLDDFLGLNHENVIGKNIKEILGEENIDRLHQYVRDYGLQPLKSASIDINGTHFDLVAHYSDNHMIIECEASVKDDHEYASYDNFYDELRNFAVSLRQHGNTEKLYKLIVDKVREITGFDRVKLYKFDEDWNGAVISEARADFMPSYLGLNFPSTDIPEQARKLYETNYLRLISDIHYKPVDIFPDASENASEPLDMSLSALRSVSPIHIQYLDNINVSASMSVSILQNDKLWGLIACHHSKPKFIPYRIRIFSEIVGHIFSAQLSSLQIVQRKELAEKKKILIEKLSARLNIDTRLEDVFSGNHKVALEALAADGLAIKSGKRIEVYGDTPPENKVSKLMEWCQDKLEDNLYYTDVASQRLKEDPELSEIMGGFLALPIDTSLDNMVIWFRTAKDQLVNWAGDPEKPVEKTKAGYRLTPRSSFKLWQTTMKGKSIPWSIEDVEAAKSVSSLILENDKILSEQANQAKSEFLANMSHELRTPMNVVVGIIDILNKDKNLEDKQKELISSLDTSATTLMNLINDLLDISKIEANEMKFEFLPITIQDILEDIRSLHRVPAADKNISLNVNYARCDDTKYLGDPVRIRQILSNLVNNAIKFTPKGFVNILAICEEENSDGATNIVFEISDSGIGMTEKQIEGIYQKFVQADVSITRQYGGTGLGLAISKRLVELMGGSIDVTSKKDMGTKFTVSIPMKEAEKKEAIKLPNKKPKEKMNERGTILLVEDYEGNIVVALHFLQEQGYDVIIARNGKEALEKLDNTTFDVILMDVQMPIMDGYTATGIIREKQKFGSYLPMPIIGMTANAFKEDKEKCLAAGMDDYISKPYDFDNLIDKIDYHMMKMKSKRS